MEKYGVSHVLNAISAYSPEVYFRSVSYFAYLFYLPILAIPVEAISWLIANGVYLKTKAPKVRPKPFIFLLMGFGAVLTSFLDSLYGNSITQAVGHNWYILASSIGSFFMYWTVVNSFINIKYILTPVSDSRQTEVGKGRIEYLPRSTSNLNHQLRNRNMSVWTSSLLTTIGDVEFEQLTARVFDNLGFETELTPGGGDGGVDIYARFGNEVYVISCKRYKDIVAPMYVRDIHSVAVMENADAAFLVTSGRFSDDVKARSQVMRPRVYLIDGEQLANLLNGVPGVTVYG